ncbi:TIR domain-containing protein [Frankia sp. AiPs1]
MERELSALEVRTLAEVFSRRAEAGALLDDVGIPRGRQPGWASADAELFWHEVARMLANGVIAGGALALLRAAHEKYPGNAVFAFAVGADGKPATGSTPRDEEPEDVTAPEEEGRRDFFVSYTPADQDWAVWIAWTLEEGGYRVLLQAWDFAPGSNWLVGMERGIQLAGRTLAVISSSYLGSVFGQSEWQAAFRADPRGAARRLIPIRVEDVAAPPILGSIVSVDLFGLDRQEARARLLDSIAFALRGRARPRKEPSFPVGPPGGMEPRFPVGTAGGDDIAGVVLSPPPRGNHRPDFPTEDNHGRRPIFDLGDVFISSQIPNVTFVQQELFIPFKMKLRQPGLSVIVEGAAGSGKTTMLRHAIEQDQAGFAKVDWRTAREPKDIDLIWKAVEEGHDELLVIDDFHRLPYDLKGRVVDYLKKLADQGAAKAPRKGVRPAKIVIAGIPETARSLIRMSRDIAPRTYVMEAKPATRLELAALVELGERALNIEFDNRQAIVDMASGSLIVAQELCWWLATLSGVEETVLRTRRIETDIDHAAYWVHDGLQKVFKEPVADFIALDGADESICVELLQALAHNPRGVLSLDHYKRSHPQRARSVERIFVEKVVDQIAADSDISSILYYDARGRRLVADNPQFWFYLKLLRDDDLSA